MVEINNLGTTVFFSSHIISDVEEICDSVIFLKSGKLVFNGSVDKLILDNIKPLSSIRFKKDDKFSSITVDNKLKTEKIKELINQDVDIISIEQEKPTLEQIFYNVK